MRHSLIPLLTSFAALLTQCAPLPALAGGGLALGAGHAALTQLRTPYATASPAPSTSAYITLVASTPAQTNLIELYETGGYPFYLSWAATCATLASTANTVLVGAGSSGDLSIYIPPLACVGAKWVGTAPTTGELDLSFLN